MDSSDPADPEPDSRPERADPSGRHFLRPGGVLAARPANDPPAPRLVAGALALDAREQRAEPVAREVAAPMRAAQVLALPSTPRAEPEAAQAPCRVVKRPPVLASEALRLDLMPPTPAKRAGRIALLSVGALGLTLTARLGHVDPLGLSLASAFLALLTLGLLPFHYRGRATVAAIAAGTGALAIQAFEPHQAALLTPPLLRVAISVLAAALLLRAWHRASRIARVLIALGLCFFMAWLVISGALAPLLGLTGPFEHWIAPLLAAVLVVNLLLSLLGFMDARSTGGAHVWAGLLLGWSTLYSTATLLPLAMSDAHAQLTWSAIPAEIALCVLAGPLLQIALAVGIAQSLAAMCACSDQRPT